MAEATAFEGADHVMSKPDDMTADECFALATQPVTVYDRPSYLSCWKLTKEELEEINKTGRVWLICVNVMPPVMVMGIKPQIINQGDMHGT